MIRVIFGRIFTINPDWNYDLASLLFLMLSQIFKTCFLNQPYLIFYY